MAQILARELVLTIGGTDVSVEITNARISAEDSDSGLLTYAKARSGDTKDWFINVTAAQDTAVGSLWSQVFDNAGSTVAYVLKPSGNSVASVAQPHFTGNVVIPAPDGDFLGGEANSSAVAVQTFESKWQCTAKPTRKTTA